MITTFQIFWVFAVSSNNDAKVLIKQMTKFLANSKYKVSLKKTLGGWEKFFLWKLTYIALCKFSRFWLRFYSFWGNFFKDLLISLIIGWQVVFQAECRTNILIYWNFVVITFSNFQYLWTFSKSHCLCSGNLRKISRIWFIHTAWRVSKYGVFSCLHFPAFRLNTAQKKLRIWTLFTRCQERWIYFLVKSRNSQIFYITNIMTFWKFAQEIYFYLLVAGLYIIQSNSKIFIHFMPAPMP